MSHLRWHRGRARASQAIDNRYAEALASIDVDDPLSKLLFPPYRSVRRGRRPYRGLRPISAADLDLMRAVSRGEFSISGFRNRDIRTILFPKQLDPARQRGLYSRVSRLFALLRAHRLIRRLPRTHRYVLIANGHEVATAILAVQSSRIKSLLQEAARKSRDQGAWYWQENQICRLINHQTKVPCNN